MATYYPSSSSSSSNQRDVLPTQYIGDQKLLSYPELPIHPGKIMMHLSQAYSSGSYSEIWSGSPMSPHNCVDPSVGGRNEVQFIPPTSETASMPSIDGLLNNARSNLVGDYVTGGPQVVPRTELGVLDGEQNFQSQGLALSLGTQMPSADYVPSFQYQHPPGVPSFFNAQLRNLGDGTISCQGDEINQCDEFNQCDELRNSECLPSGFTGRNHSAIRMEAPCNPQCSLSSEGMHSDMYVDGPSGYANTNLNSKFLEAAQKLLDEVVNVRKALKQPKPNIPNFNKISLDDCKETDGTSGGRSMPSASNSMSSKPSESITKSSSELSPAERQDLQNKVMKLLSMLDEVDRRYIKYYQQMQVVVSSFDIVAGCGAAKPYTALALQTISRHFRCLRDAIHGQIQVTQRRLGEQDTSPGGVIPRLRYVDHQLKRQHNAFQQPGVMQHSWRPHRGLPERTVSILRAWLFEHFLHPYPNDSEKIILARQTGLTRNQVANWFINARVRLWKPMVEEMYREEFGDSEMNSKSSQENAPKAQGDNSSTSEDRGEELLGSVTSTAADGVHPGQVCDLNSDHVPNVETIEWTNSKNNVSEWFSWR